MKVNTAEQIRDFITMSKKHHAEGEKAGEQFLLWQTRKKKYFNTKKQCSQFSLTYNTCKDRECLRVKKGFPTDPLRKTFSQTTHKDRNWGGNGHNDTAENVSWPNTSSVTFLHTAPLQTNTICYIHSPALVVPKQVGRSALMQHFFYNAFNGPWGHFLGLLNSLSSQL